MICKKRFSTLHDLLNNFMHEKLSHLTEAQIQELKEQYYDPDKTYTVSEIIEEFGLDIRSRDFTSLLPDTVYEECCPYCENTNFRSKARSRSSYGSPAVFCPDCGHKHGVYCNCKNCTQRQQAEREYQDHRQRALVQECYGPSTWGQPIDVQSLTLEDMVFLKAVVMHSATEDLSEVDLYAQTQTALAPSGFLIGEIASRLYRVGLIIPSHESDLVAFIFDDEESEPRFYMNKVIWFLLPQLSSLERQQFLREVDKRLASLAEVEGLELAERVLWHKLIKHEALEYYLLKVREVNIEIDRIGDKTHAVFDDLAERLSLAHIYHVIFATVKNTHFYITQQGIPRYQAKNMFVGAIERNAIRYEAEGWLKEYRRDFNCPQTAVSTVYFGYYLGLGDSYFNTSLPTLPNENK